MQTVATPPQAPTVPTRSAEPLPLGPVLVGAVAGLAGGLAMTLVMLLLRDNLGVATPPEMVGDRMTALISIQQFFALLDQFGGYNGLKQVGGGSVLAGQIVVGALAGGLYVLLARNKRRPWTIAVAIVGVLWLLTVVLLWPQLATNARGLPPEAARLTTAVSLLLVYGVYGLVLVLGTSAWRFGSREPAVIPSQPVVAAPGTASLGRRALLLGGVAAVLAIASNAVLQGLIKRAVFPYDGTEYRGANLAPVTPNDRFYSVTKNIVDPNPTTDAWRLEIAGLVGQSHTYALDELRALPSVTQETTLMCISNYIGGGLMSNAVWRGLPLRDLLMSAGIRPGATGVVLHGADGYTDTYPLAKALEPTTFVAYEMNGDAIPMRHGYPVRILTPGLFGEKSVKWVTQVEVVDHEVKGFYEQQGWGPSFVIPTRSTWMVGGFQTPWNPGQPLTLPGNAFAGTRGIASVDVSDDGGQTWQPARITYPGTDITWSFWSFDWYPRQPGSYDLVARATDKQGGVQTSDYRDTQPQGATGFHTISITLTA